MPKNFQVIIHALTDGERFSKSVTRCAIDLLTKKLTIVTTPPTDDISVDLCNSAIDVDVFEAGYMYSYRLTGSTVLEHGVSFTEDGIERTLVIQYRDVSIVFRTDIPDNHDGDFHTAEEVITKIQVPS